MVPRDDGLNNSRTSERGASFSINTASSMWIAPMMMDGHRCTLLPSIWTTRYITLHMYRHENEYLLSLCVVDVRVAQASEHQCEPCQLGWQPTATVLCQALVRRQCQEQRDYTTIPWAQYVERTRERTRSRSRSTESASDSQHLLLMVLV